MLSTDLTQGPSHNSQKWPEPKSGVRQSSWLNHPGALHMYSLKQSLFFPFSCSFNYSKVKFLYDPLILNLITAWHRVSLSVTQSSDIFLCKYQCMFEFNTNKVPYKNGKFYFLWFLKYYFPMIYPTWYVSFKLQMDLPNLH